MKNFFEKRALAGRSRRRGVSVVIVSLAMIALLGFCAMAVDYGMLTNDANQLQRGCDAGALAGAPFLKVTGDDNTDSAVALSNALYVASQNGVTVAASDVTFLNNFTQIKVTGTRSRNFFFAQALGMSRGSVTRAAVAGINGITNFTTGGAAQAVPMGITQETDNAYKNDQRNDITLTLIRANKTDFLRDTSDPIEPDPFVEFDLGGGNAKSPAHMQNQTAGSEVVPVAIGNMETTLNAAGSSSQTLHMERGWDARFARAAAAPWNDVTGTLADSIANGTARQDNPRIVSIIVTTKNSPFSGGTTQLPVLSLQPVYVEGYSTTIINGVSVTQLHVRFLKPITLSSGQLPPGPPGTIPVGIRVATLVG